jgi:uncharacterized protein
MKLAIISDTHDNLTNIEKFVSWAKENKIETIIHCGDIASGDTVEFLAKQFFGTIHLAYGNMDANYRDDIYLASDNLNNVKLHGNQGELTISNSKSINDLDPVRHDGRVKPAHNALPASSVKRSFSGWRSNVDRPGMTGIKIAFCHFPEVAKELAETGKYNLVFYGHTHKPWMETLNNHCQLINPGTLGGVFQKATFASYDTTTNKLELKILELI